MGLFWGILFADFELALAASPKEAGAHYFIFHYF